MMTKGKVLLSLVQSLGGTMKKMNTMSVIINTANDEKRKISAIVRDFEAVESGQSDNELTERMLQLLQVMRASSERGLNPSLKSESGLSGGSAYKIAEAGKSGRLAADKLSILIMTRALAISECNATMGRIVACPTAGSCGVVPAVLLSLADCYGFSDKDLTNVLFTAASVGLVIATHATISGAEGGCQAECGSAAAMAAAATVELMGGTPDMVGHAVALVIKSMLGLICDPVAGLVEVPCVKRNATAAMTAVTCANLALAGIESMIPADEVILAMKEVGQNMPKMWKETAEGGIAVTPTALAFSDKYYGKIL